MDVEVVVLVATEPFLELDVDVEVVVVDGAAPPPSPPPADSIDVEDVADVVLVEVDFTVTETTELEWLILTIDCGAGTEDVLMDVDVVVLKPNPPVTPTLSVGIVTETAGAAELIAMGVVAMSVEEDLSTVKVV